MPAPRRNSPQDCPGKTQRTAAGGAPRTPHGEIDVGGRPAGWVRDGALDGRPVILLAHGAGAPFTSPFMEAVASGLVQRGLAVVRFHFPYMERSVREGVRRPPDRADVLVDTLRAMLAAVCSWDAGRGATHEPRLVLAGKSMGGRMISMLLAQGRARNGAHVRGAVYLGYPLQPAGNPHPLRADHLKEVTVPQLFVSGSRDALCNLELLRDALRPVGHRVRLHVVEGGDHSLATSRREPLAGSSVWLDVVADFVREVASAPRRA